MRWMRSGTIVLATLATAMVALPAGLTSPARAEVIYPWCAYYGGRGMEATNCGFVTREQCMATISGIGGFCEPNPAYHGPGKKPYRRRHRG